MSASLAAKTPDETSSYAAHYEDLRSRVLDRATGASRHGLALLLRGGLAAWIGGWSTCTPPPLVSRNDTPELGQVPDGCCASIVNVLAAMALNHVQEVNT
jgi:hypothetical protein